MNKSLAIATALLAAAAMFTSAAEAGFSVRLGFGGPLPAFTAHGNSDSYGRKLSHKRRTHQVARHHEKAPVRVSKKSATTVNVAKVEAQPEAKPVTTVAETENSSIAAAGTKLTENKPAESVKMAAATSKEPAVASKIDCKKFFPSVGMTLTVPCE